MKKPVTQILNFIWGIFYFATAITLLAIQIEKMSRGIEIYISILWLLYGMYVAVIGVKKIEKSVDYQNENNA
jgi:hypothetical protein